jgi:hypothetical protein
MTLARNCDDSSLFFILQSIKTFTFRGDLYRDGIKYKEFVYSTSHMQC